MMRKEHYIKLFQLCVYANSWSQAATGGVNVLHVTHVTNVQSYLAVYFPKLRMNCS